MTRPLLALALLAGATASAQPATSGDPALAATSEHLRDDLAPLTWLTATAALAHDETGAFPATAFDLLSGPWATQTGVRSVPLSSLDVRAEGGRVVLTYVPLPTAPYVREDDVVRLTVSADGDAYRGTYEILRREDPDLGGRPLPYDVAGRYRVERAFGTVCVEVPRVRALVAEGRFVPDPAALSAEPLTLRVHPPGEPAPVYFETTRPARAPRP